MDKYTNTYITVLKAEIEHLKLKIEPRLGKLQSHIPTTIETLQTRVKELEQQRS